MKQFLSLLLAINLTFAPISAAASQTQDLSVSAAKTPETAAETETAKTPETSSEPSESAETSAELTETAAEPALNISAPSALLMEASTGTVIYEKNAHERLHPASITKIMTLILIFDALEKNQIALGDTVTVSEHAASMGGSQVFLEPWRQ